MRLTKRAMVQPVPVPIVSPIWPIPVPAVPFHDDTHDSALPRGIEARCCPMKYHFGEIRGKVAATRALFKRHATTPSPPARTSDNRAISNGFSSGTLNVPRNAISFLSSNSISNKFSMENSINFARMGGWLERKFSESR